MKITVDDIIDVYNDYDTLKVIQIKNILYRNRENSFLPYINRYSFDQTIQAIINKHCTEYKDYKGEIPYFDKVAYGTYSINRVVTNQHRLKGFQTNNENQKSQIREEKLKSVLENISIENEEDLELTSRTLREQNIIDRDRSIVKALKEHYQNICQIKSCNKQITLVSGEKYSEVHHLHPLGEEGFDVAENMIVVCPNCHVELDFGKAISKDDIYIKEPHFIKDEHIEFQNNKQAIKN